MACYACNREHACVHATRHVFLAQSDKRQDSGDDDNCADDIDDAVHEFPFRARLEIKSRVKGNATPFTPMLTIPLSGKTLRAPARTSANRAALRPQLAEFAAPSRTTTSWAQGLASSATPKCSSAYRRRLRRGGRSKSEAAPDVIPTMQSSLS